jgi:hypothetical protein
VRSFVWHDLDFPITQPFGCTDLAVEPWWPAKGCHWHCGVDVGMPVGTLLAAARSGSVYQSFYGGLVVKVDGVLEYDCYIHIDSAVVSVGQHVVSGQPVATSGAKVPSGGSLTGPHLHFEVQSGTLNTPATSLDPLPVLGAQEEDLTPQQDANLNEILNGLRDLNEGLFYGTGTPNAGNQFSDLLEARIRAIVSSELAKHPLGAVPTKLTGTVNATLTT